VDVDEDKLMKSSVLGGILPKKLISMFAKLLIGSLLELQICSPNDKYIVTSDRDFKIQVIFSTSLILNDSEYSQCHLIQAAQSSCSVAFFNTNSFQVK